MEAVDTPAVGRIGPVREQRVPWCAAHALADPVGKPDGEHLPPAGDERDEWARRGREHVTRNHQAAPGAGAIGQPTGNNTQKAVGALRYALDQAERDRSAAEHRRKKEREQRINRFRCSVREQAHPPEQPHRGWKRAPNHWAQCSSVP
jgi:hypothetical protein